MKKEVTKKVTIDDLAVMVANGFDRVESSLEKVEDRLGNVESRLGEVEKDIIEVKENLAGTRRDVLEIGDRFVQRYEFHDLLVRFDRLEQKVAGK